MRIESKGAVQTLVAAITCVISSATAASADTYTRTIVMPSGNTYTNSVPDEVVTSRKVLIVPQSSPGFVTTSRSIETVNEGLGSPRFDRRLQLMREQLNMGIAHNWVSTTDAVSFSNRLNDIGAMRGSGDPDALERQLNQVNIDLSNAMNRPSVLDLR